MRRSSATVPVRVSPPSRTQFTRRRSAFPALAALCLLLSGLLPLGLSSANNARAQESAVPFGDVIVVLTDPRADAARFARDEGVNPRRVYQHVFRGFSANITQRRAEHLAKHPRVALISPIVEFQVAAQEIPNGVNRVEADVNPTANINGVENEVDADIAVLDGGVDTDHLDLNVAGGVDCISDQYTPTFDDPGLGHGTHVAGTAAATDNDYGVVGVAPGARIWSARVLYYNNSNPNIDDGEGTTETIICGLDWVISHADTIDVVNMSLAAQIGDSTCANDVLHLAICNVVAAGVPVVVAAGNYNTDASNFAPAAYDEVITVSNFADFNGEPGGGGTRPLGCNWSGTDDRFSTSSNDGQVVDIAAPGTCVMSTLPNNSYGFSTGTSMSTPHVVGAIALYKSVNPGASPAQAKAWLLEYGQSQTGPNGFTGDTDGFPEPVLSVGQSIGQAPPPEPGPPFLEGSGQVVMEAEHAQRLVSRADHAWYFRDEDTGVYISGFAGDGFVRLEPDSGDYWLDNYASAAPELQFDVQFSTPGTYYVWARAQADNNSADSLHVGIDGNDPASAKYIQIDDNVGWNWSKTHDDLDGTPVATITVPSAGLHTISIWPREDGVRVDRIFLTTDANDEPEEMDLPESPQGEPPPAAFQETDGFVQFEAEDQHAQIDRGNHDWRFENDVIAGYSGVGYLRVRPDNGDYWLSSFASSSPEVQYNVDFETPGTYYVWARLQATDAADDSFHVGVNGVPVASATNMGTDGVGGGFRWSNRRGGSVGTITITSPGVRTINFWAREDGLRMDQVILTTDGGFAPAAEPEPPADLIEIEAEDFANAIARDGHAWSDETTVPGYSGAGYVGVTPDDGSSWTSGYTSSAPELQYDVEFPTAGTYQIWFLTQADDGGDNSLHAGIDGVSQTSAENVTTGTGGSWSWQSATLSVATAGAHSVNIWAREDGLRLDKLILTTDDVFVPQAVAASAEATPSPTPEPTPEPTVEPTATAEPLPPFAEQQGTVVLEAEAFHAETPRGDAAWTVQSDVEGFAGTGFVRAEPDNGLTIDAGYAETSPALTYEVEFAGAGTYSLWLRGLATGEGDDTIHVGVDGQEVTTARAIDLVEDSTWQWTNAAADGVATVEIPGPGLHTITVWMAEDGVRLDRLVLTADAAFVPDGQGPPASPRTDVAAASSAPVVTPDASPTATPEPSPTTAPTEEVTPEPSATPTEPPPTETLTPELTATPPPEPTPTEGPVEEEAEETVAV